MAKKRSLSIKSNHLKEQKAEKFYWVCRFCHKDSPLQKPEAKRMPKGFLDDPVFGVVCDRCLKAEKKKLKDGR